MTASGGHAAGVDPGEVQSLHLGRRLDLPLPAGAPAFVVVALGDDRLPVVAVVGAGDAGEEIGGLLVERAFLVGVAHAGCSFATWFATRKTGSSQPSAIGWKSTVSSVPISISAGS